MVELGYTKTPRFDYSLLETWSKLLDIVRVNTEIDVVLKTTVSSSHDDGVIIQVQNKAFRIDLEFLTLLKINSNFFSWCFILLQDF